MTFPPCRPLTPFNRKPAILTMVLRAANFTLRAASYHEPANSAGEDIPWQAVLWFYLIFFGHGREWWKLLLQSHGTGIGGVAQLLEFTGLVPIAVGMWAWTLAIAAVVFWT